MPAAMTGSTSNSAATASEQDILGALPDCLLLSILSFLPTLDAVRTSVLSRRWRYLWTSIDTLDLDDVSDDFFYLQSSREWKMGENKFAEFVDKVLTSHHAPVLQRFRLFCRQYEYYPLEAWIRAAVTRNARELDLLLFHRYGRLPSSLFVSHSLVDLKLDLDCDELTLPAVLDLPGLRSLYLGSVSFWDSHLTSKLLASCTALRRLVIEQCIYEGLECLEISCPLLESLTIDCSGGCAISRLGDCQLKILAPQLTFFKYRAPFTQIQAVKPLSSLVDVEVVLYEVTNKFGAQVQDFLRQLSSAKNLKIDQRCVEAMWTIPSSPMVSSSPFHSLKRLKVGARFLNDKILCNILRLLVANPCLRLLSLEGYEVVPPHGYAEEYLKILKVDSEQVSGALEEVEITCPDLSDPLLQLVKVLLAKEVSLKRLVFRSRSCTSISLQRPKKRKRLLQKVLSFPRRSCNLVVDLL